MRRAIILGLTLALALSTQAAWAGKKPKPYKSEEVSIAIAHPIFYSTTESVNTVTAKEFEARCAIPASNGLDAYVFEVPAAFQKVAASVEAIGSASGPLGYDLDMFIYDKSCQLTTVFNAEGTDEAGMIPKGTGYVLVQNYLGDPGTKLHIELKV